MVISGNGARDESRQSGLVNESKFFNGYIDTVEESLGFLTGLVGPRPRTHYLIGWSDGLPRRPTTPQGV